MFKNQTKPKVIRNLATPYNGDNYLVKDNIIVISGNNEKVPVEAITMDTMPNGSSKGTIIAIAGSPGSHYDFKYMLPFFIENKYRFIGINYPGYGVTKEHWNLTETNKEKTDYVKNIMRVRNISSDDDVIFMGHSRGTKTALELAGTYNEEKTKGVVLINGVGIRKHRGIQPFFPIFLFANLWDKFIFARKYFINPIIFVMYNQLGLKTASPEMAARCLKSIYTFDLPSQKQYVDMVNGRECKVLQLGGGKDWLIEKDISMEFYKLFKGLKLIESNKLNDDEEIMDKISKEFHDGAKSVSVYFEKEGHFLNKFRATVIANAIDTMFKLSKTDFKNKL
uniref:Hydrolase_4 domain-containing protein n=1 Tax=Parastrongyloides trichosuri TaxID=131310 RepID=A0A0N5A1K7_PARTI